jgi:hypothetical protein
VDGPRNEGLKGTQNHAEHVLWCYFQAHLPHGFAPLRPGVKRIRTNGGRMVQIRVPGLMALRIAAAATFAIAVLLVSSFCGDTSAREIQNRRDGFFERLMVGGAEKGTVYLEIPLKASLFANTKTFEDRWAVWDAFFARVLRESPDSTRPGRAPYWGNFAYQNIDWSSVESAVDLRVGDVLRVRTPNAEGSAKVVSYAIHYNSASGANLLLAVAQPLADFKVSDTDFLVAASRLPPCGKRCTTRATIPDARTLTKIRKALRRGAKIPTGQQIKQIIALQGSFTRPARQYAVYADFGRDSDTNLVGYWRTVILDSDLSIIAVVGENEYTHIQPRSVGDVDGDGLDEVWVGLTGYEGHHAGLIYWRGGAGNDAFGTIENAYDGA